MVHCRCGCSASGVSCLCGLLEPREHALDGSRDGLHDTHCIKRQGRGWDLRRMLEAVALNLCGIMWSADNVLLPAVYLQVGNYFDIGPAELGLLTFVRGVTESIFSFPAGFASEIYDRPKLICGAVMLWSIGLAGCAFVPSFSGLVICRMINGAGLGLVQPWLYSLISDTNDPSTRGIAFGTLQFTGDLGTAFGAFVATSLASERLFGFEGWQFVLVLYAIISTAVGVLVLTVARETRERSEASSTSLWGAIRKNAPAACGILRVKTFAVIIGQGIFGTAPWFSLAYLTMWLQLLCFSAQRAATIMMFFPLGTAVGGLISGELLDAVSARFPDHGPAWLAMFSVASGIPLFGYVFYGVGGVPLPDRDIFPEMCVALMLTGSLLSWCGVVNKKIFVEIVPGELYTYIFGLDRMLEGSFAALATPAVGVITETLFGYVAKEDAECAPTEGQKLGDGMFLVCAVAWSICFLFYTLLHCTYPQDRRALLRHQRLDESEYDDSSVDVKGKPSASTYGKTELECTDA
mmetsp:Transcript_18921/g.44012  ORF Transcript_18921/g.44012 Transcript_18921/m.44012 type:complete len:521 (+) Transcript_18921:64-1626(+)